jgi:serine/threonine-protein kinase HipA
VAGRLPIFLEKGSTYEMTPLYDILSFWPYIGEGRGKLSRHKVGMAMAVRSKNAHYHFKDIQARHWQQLAMKYGGDALWLAMLELVVRVNPALDAVEQRLPKDFPEQTWMAISAGMRGEVARFDSQLGELLA